MITLENKLQNFYDKLTLIILRHKKICLNKLNTLPKKIEQIVIGDDKLPSCIDRTIQELTASDFNGIESIKREVFCDCKNLTNLIIPNNIISIGFCSFEGCSNLISATIPNSVTNIGGRAFNRCSKLADIYLYPITPPTLGSTNAIPTTTTIHVPIGSGDAYKNATNWSSHADKIVEDIEI